MDLYPERRGGGFFRKAAFVLQVIDDFKNTPVKAGLVSVMLEDGRRPIQTAEGYFVFMDLLPGIYRVCLNGPIYQPLWIELEAGAAPCPVAAVRMLPGSTYPLPEGSCRISGTCAPGACVRLTYTWPDRPLKLLFDYEGGPVIRIFSPSAAALDGRELCISGKEFFTIRQTLDMEDRVYLMDKPLKGSYKKGAAMISYTSSVHADDQGNFFMAVQNSSGKSLNGVIGIPGKKKTEKAVELTGGQQLLLRNFSRESGS